MLFNSLDFIAIFVPATLFTVWAALRFVGQRGGVVALIVASLIFYAQWAYWAVGLLCASTLINFYCGKLMLHLANSGPRRVLLAMTVTVNLIVLGYFKYSDFLLDNIRQMGVEVGVLQLVLPLGISFYTFQKIAFINDVYQGRIKSIPGPEFVLMVCFFPQLVAGPIVHFREIVPQFLSSLRVTWGSIAIGLSVFAVGLCKKVAIADTLATYASPQFTMASKGTVEFFSAWIGALAYTFQLYFDFSGYSDMAIGLALMFGIALPVNFLSPYKSTSIVEFWRRWHMTLSRFLRDYLYIPLGGNHHGSERRYLNLLIVMLLGGLWHGAAWTFVVWGGLHGVYLIMNHAWQRAGLYMPRVIGWIVTFVAVVVGWVFFRAPDIPTAVVMLKGMAGQQGAWVPLGVLDWLDLLSWSDWSGETLVSIDFIAAWIVIAIAAVVAFAMPNTMQIFGIVDDKPSVAGALMRRFLRSPFYVGLVLWLSMLWVAGAAPTEFLYYQF